MRRGVFGGTFDPPHEGHVAVALAARRALALDVVLCIPTCVPPHRPPPVATPIDRYTMLALAIDGCEGLVASPIEIERAGVSYTIDTLRAIRREHPDDELFLIIGRDSYDEIDGWRDAAGIRALAHLAVLPRPGSPGAVMPRPGDEARWRLPGTPPPASGHAVYAIPMIESPARSREIREALRDNRPALGLAPAVERYIRARRLYREEAPSG